MNDSDNKRAMLIELIDGPSRDDLPKPNITAAEYAEEKGITPAAAYGRLERRTDAKILKKQTVLIDERERCVYWAATLEPR